MLSILIILLLIVGIVVKDLLFFNLIVNFIFVLLAGFLLGILSPLKLFLTLSGTLYVLLMKFKLLLIITKNIAKSYFVLSLLVMNLRCLMACNSPLTLVYKGVTYDNIPCRNCMSCRIANRNYWALRCRLQAYTYALDGRSSCFVGLSYAPDFLPTDKRGLPNLSKRDVTLFLKRFRADYAYKNGSNADFKYYIVGELGDLRKRSHYHCIFLGIPSHSMPFRKYWQKGFVTDVPLTTGRIRYALSYMDKQIPFKESVKLKELYDFQSPFVLRSKSIGVDYLLDNLDFIKEYNGIKNNGHVIPLKSYYRKKFGLDEFDDSTVKFFEKSRALREFKSISEMRESDFRARELSLLARSRFQGYPAKGANLDYSGTSDGFKKAYFNSIVESALDNEGV